MTHDVDELDPVRRAEPEAELDQDPATPRRKAWTPEAGTEAAGLLRRLALNPWLVGGRDDETIAAVRRNEPAIRATVARSTARPGR